SIFLMILLLVLTSTSNAQQWSAIKSYKGEELKKIAMPLGGIGTGSVSIGGRGDLKDWEIVNQGALGWKPVFNSSFSSINIAPFFAIHTRDHKNNTQIRLLEGPLSDENLQGDWGSNELNSGFPRFDEGEFKSAYPLAQIQLKSEQSPIKVSLNAFNPMIPGDTKNSSIPVAVLKYVVHNRTAEELEITVCGVIPNFIGTDGWGGSSSGNKNTFRSQNGISGVYMENVNKDTISGKWGTMALVTPANEGVSYRTQWKSDLRWSGSLIDFWDDLNDDGRLSDRTEGGKTYPGNKPATLAITDNIPAFEKKEFVFILTWNFPYRVGWESQPGVDHEIIKNHYATVYKDAWDVALDVNERYEYLESKTLEFVKAFTSADIPNILKEAALYNVANLRSQTVFRDQDGYTFGWEGTGSVQGTTLNPKGARSGWGFGSCTHVWNYEVTTPFLFGDVAMSMREVEFKYATNPKTGMMAHRVRIPVKTAVQKTKSAADGQLGCIMKMYREWQLSGDNVKLKELYPFVKKALEFSWEESKWDADANGVLEGEHHNTMDVNYLGPNPQMSTWYLGALLSGEKMALAMNDKGFAKKCRAMFKNGSQWVDDNLFNGKYYIQKLPKPVDYQVGEGILVDQLVGQYMAHVCGLGYLLKKENIETTLKTIRKYNWKDGFNDHLSTFRAYATGNEKGLIMGYYPEGKREARPFPYYSEVMTGFEYSTGAHMIYEGLLEQGLEIFSAVRDRYDGKKRNPFNEGEFGHRYGRAMASWSGILAYTGFEYSAVAKIMKFNAMEGNFFWSNGYAYGTVKISEHNNKYTTDITVLSGKLALKEFHFKDANTLKMNKELEINSGETYKLPLK
ncbi:MAG: non-lysosomal glucosylceramidase, partial [Cytophagales bacterium]|nr:non-lysosomal glucosylceramidase [Cytophagales bacterium]